MNKKFILGLISTLLVSNAFAAAPAKNRIELNYNNESSNQYYNAFNDREALLNSGIKNNYPYVVGISQEVSEDFDMYALLPDYLTVANFLTRYTQENISFVPETNSERMANSLRNGRFDIAIVNAETVESAIDSGYHVYAKTEKATKAYVLLNNNNANANVKNFSNLRGKNIAYQNQNSTAFILKYELAKSNNNDVNLINVGKMSYKELLENLSKEKYDGLIISESNLQNMKKNGSLKNFKKALVTLTASENYFLVANDNVPSVITQKLVNVLGSISNSNSYVRDSLYNFLSYDYNFVKASDKDVQNIINMTKTNVKK